MMQKVKEKTLKNKNVTMTKTRYRGGDLWTIKVKGGFIGKKPRRRDRPRKEKKPLKTESLFVYIGKDEVILTTSRSYLAKALIKSSETVLQRLFKLSISELDNTNSVFYLNIETIVRYLNNSSLAAVLRGYLPIFQNMKNINIQSYTSRNVISTEFNLKLKP